MDTFIEKQNGHAACEHTPSQQCAACAQFRMHMEKCAFELLFMIFIVDAFFVVVLAISVISQMTSSQKIHQSLPHQIKQNESSDCSALFCICHLNEKKLVNFSACHRILPNCLRSFLRFDWKANLKIAFNCNNLTERMCWCFPHLDYIDFRLVVVFFGDICVSFHFLEPIRYVPTLICKLLRMKSERTLRSGYTLHSNMHFAMLFEVHSPIALFGPLMVCVCGFICRKSNYDEGYFINSMKRKSRVNLNRKAAVKQFGVCKSNKMRRIKLQ